MKKLSIWYNDQPTEYLIYSVGKTEENSLSFVHIREPEEIQKFIDKLRENNIQCDCYTLLLKRNNDLYNNDSDDSVDNFDYDFVIYNDSNVHDLGYKVLDFLSKIGIRTYVPVE